MRDRLIVCISALLFIASQVAIAAILLPLHPSIFSIQFSFTPESFWHILDLWGSSGLAAYRAHFPLDFVHPFLYGVLGVLLTTKTSLFTSVRTLAYRIALWSLPVAGIFDLFENVGRLYLLGQPHGSRSILIPATATCSSLKWALALLFTLTVASQAAYKRWAKPVARDVAQAPLYPGHAGEGDPDGA